MHSAERECYIALLHSKDPEEDFKWPSFLSQEDRKLMRDRSRSLSLSDAGKLLYQGKLVPTVAECLDALEDLHPPETTTRAHASLLNEKGFKLPAFLGGNQAATARLVTVHVV